MASCPLSILIEWMILQQRQIIMSSDSDFSSSQEADQQTRLHSIWKSIRQTKNLSHMHRSGELKEDHSINQNRRSQQASFIRNNQQPDPREDHLKENLAHLLQKFQQAQKEIEYLKNEMEKVKRSASDNIEGQKKQYESKLKRQLKKFKADEKENAYGNSDDKYQIQQLTKEVNRLNLRIRSLQHEKKAADAQIERLSQLNETYEHRSKEQEEASELLAHQGRGQQLLELTEAHNTIDRLLQLLKKTEEFREIVPILEEAKGMHYLKNILKRIKAGQINIHPNNKKACSCASTKINEKLVWSPAECYRLLLNLKLKYDYLSEDCIEEVLFEMNRIYGAKEDRRVNKLKDHYESEAKALKKRFEENYDELLAKKQINRLKKELRVAKSCKKVKTANKLDDLRTQGQVEDELKLKMRQIRLLQDRIRLLQTENGYNDKTLYWEGALWMIDRLLTDIEDNEGGIKEFEVIFRERLDSNTEPQDWLRSYKEFFEHLSELNSGLVQKLLSIKETALRKMSQ